MQSQMFNLLPEKMPNQLKHNDCKKKSQENAQKKNNIDRRETIINFPSFIIKTNATN